MAIIQHLLVDEWGVHLGKYSERLKVTRDGQTLTQAPLLHLETVTIANPGVSISAEAVRECAERGIPIYFLSGSGSAYASLYSAGLTGTVATRRAQLEALHTGRGLQAALAFGTGKLHNQANLLKYMGKYRKESDPELFLELRRRAAEVLDCLIGMEGLRRYPEVQEGIATIEDLRSELMGFEGRAAERYWGAVQMILTGPYAAPAETAFPGRVGRGATDPLNSALNYGYGILYGQTERCLVQAGLDPYAGFLHVDRPGKPSLTLDFIEEFRPVVVDRTVIGMANKGTLFAQDEQHLLTKEVRRGLAEKIQERLESSIVYEGKHHLLRSVIQSQARHLAAWLRGERAVYEAFQASW